jgi:hypothetical protein
LRLPQVIFASAATTARRFAAVSSTLASPFLIYTGFGHADAFRSWPEAPVIAKPVEGRVLIDAVAGILN